ncbi:MAG: hypothetical protein GY862_15870, partial [Gammaproteobacteria bacterium]|nr:hypothetical protein [Gammaproteobacteria bacterium]
AREAAAEAGYAVGNDTAEFLEVLDRAWAGNKVYTPEGGAEVAEQDAVAEAKELYQNQFEGPGEAEAFEKMVAGLDSLVESTKQGYVVSSKKRAEHLEPEEIFEPGVPVILEDLEILNNDTGTSERDDRGLESQFRGSEVAAGTTSGIPRDSQERGADTGTPPEDRGSPGEPGKQEVKTAPADAGVFDSGETFAPATAATTTETVKTADGAREQAVIPGA